MRVDAKSSFFADEPDGLLKKYSQVGADISAPSAEHSELGDSPGLGVEDCSRAWRFAGPGGGGLFCAWGFGAPGGWF